MPIAWLAIDPARLPALLRGRSLAADGRRTRVRTAWHDTPDGALAADGLALIESGRSWRIERLRPVFAAGPTETLATASSPSLLGRDLPDGIAPVAVLDGTQRRLRWTGEAGTVAMEVIEGTLSGGVSPGLPVGRVRLEGEAAAIEALAAALPLTVPRASLSEQAIAAGRGIPPEPRATGAPRIEDGTSVGDGLAHVLGHLADVLLHHAALAPAAAGPEPVHQMRVALRRLRSALLVYREVADCPPIAAIAGSVKDIAATLGAARDWDVFLEGTGAKLAESFPDDPRCAALLRAAAKRRSMAYAAVTELLDGEAFRQLTVGLALAALLRPWTATAHPALEQPTSGFAGSVLHKRARRVRKDGKNLAELPIPALHELRKHGKKLRYASEFFSPLFPGKPMQRYLKRLSALQEELGTLNDGAAIAGLMTQLGRAEKGYAAGLVEGFAAAQAGDVRARILAAWRKFKAADPFWDR